MSVRFDLLAELKTLLVQCSEAELVTVRLWTDMALSRRRKPLSLVRMPSEFSVLAEAQLLTIRRPFTEIAGELRKIVHELPDDDLRVLHLWMTTLGPR
ncbi:MAG: hypothetical protein H6738_11230 [Alphaproteobacteria bacterium]|nr:hypothetical protein [Alphaproteobacteria bacterium]MCB9697342.1 hypothetical protein [Alphaproteobacteria bacterium]